MKRNINPSFSGNVNEVITDVGFIIQTSKTELKTFAAVNTNQEEMRILKKHSAYRLSMHRK